MALDFLKKDKISKFIIFLILTVSIIVAIVDIVISIIEFIPNIKAFFSLVELSDLQIFKNGIDPSKINEKMNALYLLVSIVGLAPSIFQLCISIKGFKEGVKKGSYENSGETALICGAIMLASLVSLYQEMILNFNLFNFDIKELIPNIAPTIMLTIVFGLSTFVKYCVVKKNYKKLKLLQILMCLIAIAYYALFFNMFFDKVGLEIMPRIVFFCNIAIIVLLAIEGLTSTIFLINHKKEYNEYIEESFEIEVVKEKNGIITEKVYIEKGVKNKFTNIAKILSIVFVLSAGIYIAYQCGITFKYIKSLESSLDIEGLEIYKIIMPFIELIYLFIMAFSYIKVSYAFLFVKKQLYYNIYYFNYFLLFKTILFNSALLRLMTTNRFIYIIILIPCIMLIPITKKYNAVKDEIKKGGYGKEIMQKVADINKIFASTIVIACIVATFAAHNFMLILLGVAPVCAYIIYVLELKHPRSEYYIRRRKIDPKEN